MMRVWRVENSVGDGPYQIHGRHTSRKEEKRVRALREKINFLHWNDEHPSPFEDGLGFIDGKERCGFASLQTLRTWFEGLGADLRYAGYTVLELEVADDLVRVGGRQAVFVRQKATVVRTFDPAEVIF